MTLRFKILAGIALALSLAAVAANADHHKGDSKQHIEKLTERLELTDEQIPQVEAILENAKAQRQTIGDSYTLNQRDEARVAMRQLHQETMTKMKAVLTAEQGEKLAKMEKRREHRREHKRMHKAHMAED